MKKEVQSPPKASITVHIGITGHRNLPEADMDLLSARIAEILDCVRDTTLGLADEFAAYYAEGAPTLRLLSMLAEGSDQITARCALERAYRLQCPLPMALEQYEATFSETGGKTELRRLLTKAESVLEIACCSDIPERAFQNGGYTMLGHTDILLAVWNGRDSGKVGGTFDIIERAEQMGIPVLWIDAAAPHNVRFIHGVALGLPWREGVREALRGLLGSYADGCAKDPFPAAYFAENLASKRSAGLYRAFVSFMTGKKSVRGGDGGGDADRIGVHYLAANQLAIRYGDIFRSAGILRQLLPFIATIGLAIGFYVSLFEGPSGAAPAIKQLLGVFSVCGLALQTVCFAAIIGLHRLEKARRWQRKFIDYRMLSELLRLYGHVRDTGMVIRGLDVPAHLSHVNVSWVNWHFRAIVREAGLAGSKLTPEALARCTQELKEGLLQSQILYHDNTMKTMGRIAAKLEKVGIGVYYAGVIIMVLRAAVFVLTSGPAPIALNEQGRQYLSKVFNMLSMVVPLFSSLAFGLSAQEGFDRIRGRSEAILGRLELLAGQINGSAGDYNGLIKLHEQVTDLILSEFTDWNALIRTKPISDH